MADRALIFAPNGLVYEPCTAGQRLKLLACARAKSEATPKAAAEPAAGAAAAVARSGGRVFAKKKDLKKDMKKFMEAEKTTQAKKKKTSAVRPCGSVGDLLKARRALAAKRALEKIDFDTFAQRFVCENAVVAPTVPGGLS